MKTALTLTLFLVAIFSFTACEREYSFETGTGSGGTGGTGGGGTGGGGTGGGGSTSGIFTAKIDGVPFSGNKLASGTRMGGIISLVGLSLDKKSIAITLIDSGVHNYTLSWDNSNNNAAAFMDSNLTSVIAFTSNAGDDPSESGGVLSITSIDAVNKKMSGTFSFKVKRPADNTFRTITEGVFTNLPFTTTPTTTPPSGSSTDTFSVKVNGTLFPTTSVFAQQISIMNSITILGMNGATSVGVILSTGILPGTYVLGTPSGTFLGEYNSNTDNFDAETGTLVITSHNISTKRIRGTFNFVAQSLLTGGTATITDGFFSVTYR